LRFVAEYLSAAPPKGANVQKEIQAFILQQIPRKAEAAQTEELAWLLFWTREIGLSLPQDIINACSHIRSSVVALIALDIRDLGNVSGTLDEKFWRSFCNADGLKSEMWLIAYEATMRQWWSSKESRDFITKHDFFADLYAKDVSFYDRKRTAKVTRPTPFATTSFIQYVNYTSSTPDL